MQLNQNYHLIIETVLLVSKRRVFSNGQTPASFSFIFGLFQINIPFLQQINVKKCPSSIRRQDDRISIHDLSNMSHQPWPLDQGSHPKRIVIQSRDAIKPVWLLKLYNWFQKEKLLIQLKMHTFHLDQSAIVVRGGFDAELSELCSSYQKYIYPKKAKNIYGEWHFIINTDRYKQGVTVEICIPRAKGENIDI